MVLQGMVRGGNYPVVQRTWRPGLAKCPECGKVFDKSGGPANKRYCSRDCMKVARLRQSRLSHARCASRAS